MLKILLAILTLSMPLAAVAEPHLLITEVSLGTPEFIEIANPTNDFVDLDDYYLSDAKDYRNLGCGQGLSPERKDFDFLVKFPTGSMIPPSGVIVVAIDARSFAGALGFTPDFEVRDSRVPGVRTMSPKTTVGGNTGLTNDGEGVVLFYRDPDCGEMRDVDMVNVGDRLKGKLFDVMAAATPTPNQGKSAKRVLLEAPDELLIANEVGVVKHDETSENLAITWDGVYQPLGPPDPGYFAPRQPRKIVVCLDGTWGNPQREKVRTDKKDKVFKPTNPLKVCRSVPSASSRGVSQITNYDIGVGAVAKYPGLPNKILHWVDRLLGGAIGAGFEGNVEAAYRFLAHNYLPRDQVFIFGFSRGAAEARSLAWLLNDIGGLPAKSDAYCIPLLVRAYLLSKGDFRGTPRYFCPAVRKPFAHAEIEFLGVWETVLTLGSKRNHYLGVVPPPIAHTVRQALAIDEKRGDFRPQIWLDRSTVNQSLKQVWFAGVHSNVGGGLLKDGLANAALHWLVGEARQAGLDLDMTFLGKYPPYAQDKLYNSRRHIYKLRRKYVRPLFPDGIQCLGRLEPENCLAVHRSVFARLKQHPEEPKPTKPSKRKHPMMEGQTYRAKNLLDYLASNPNCDAEFVKSGEWDLSEEVLGAIEEVRAGTPVDRRLSGCPVEG